MGAAARRTGPAATRSPRRVESDVLEPSDVLDELRKHLLVDGFDLVLDLDKSHGTFLVDARDGASYLDMFSFFASNAIGMNHPRLRDDAVLRRLAEAAIHKPSSSDVYTLEQAAFVRTFQRVLGDRRLPYLFLIEGGAMAVENALKAAFDWKSRHNEAAGRDPSLGTRVLHLTRAFHGRSGYTLSLTNTDPVKTARYPTFEWPRIDTPALRFPLDAHTAENRAAEEHALAQAREAFDRYPHDIAAFIAEPIQGEGGDRHLSGGFLHEMRRLSHAHDTLFVLDEVQTGVGLTGARWCYEHFDLEPDLVAFGKKTHVCGVMGGGRLADVDDHVFATSGRINSTFGGGLVDMVRATLILEIIEEESLVEHARVAGGALLDDLMALATRSDLVDNVRGRGLMCAVDLPDTATRDLVRQRMFTAEHVMILGSGPRSLRFRPPLTATSEELADAVAALERVLATVRR